MRRGWQLGKRGILSNPSRFGKNTHISKISNSVTHLRSYNNSAITDIAGNSVLGPNNAAPDADITVPIADITTPSTNTAVGSSMWRMF